jgi:DNA helicase IV
MRSPSPRPSSSRPSSGSPPPASDHADPLTAEQAHLDRAYECLAAMRSRADATLAIGERSVRDEDTVDAHVTRYHLERRAQALRADGGPLCFGRIDGDDGQQWHIGRRHVEDDDSRPVVVDWRAPVAAPFYRATVVDPLGLTFRRRFSIEGRTITALFDEDLTDPDAAAVGIPDPLLAELERGRSGRMGDIVATIAAEQDHIIRAPLGRLLVVQGGPGTGKTAVGLHRAAFLLFQHRRELMDTRVLVLGPNPVFLRYIADVLPSLGETSVRQTTVADLVAARFRVQATDEPAVREIKGRGDMARVIDRALRDRIVVPADGIEIRSGLAVVRFDADDLATVLKPVLEGNLPFNQGRDVARRLVVAESWRRHRSRRGVDPGTETAFTSAAGRDPGFNKGFDKLWPRLECAALIRSLYTSPRRLSRAADGLLATDEQAQLRRKGASKISEERWTAADIPLLDEADARCNGVAVRYGHIVVDEAQDLSAMALRMVARRARGHSMTVLGDLAQATTPEATVSWTESIRHLSHTVVADDGAGLDIDLEGGPDAEVAELTVGYRVPAAILDVANRLLAEAAPAVTPARSVRGGGEPLRILTTEPVELPTVLASEVAALQDRRLSVAVIVHDHDTMEAAADALMTVGVPIEVFDRSRAAAGLPGVDAVAILNPAAAKGLEFDAVVVVEPGDIAALPSGLRHLYVAMTRAVQYLSVVHCRPLPALLDLD